mgnify:CR=1 FL=1|jgi:hypothetical protein
MIRFSRLLQPKLRWHQGSNIISISTSTTTTNNDDNNDSQRPRRIQRTQSWLASPGPRITLLGSATNLALVGGKAVAGALSGSSAMVADA